MISPSVRYGHLAGEPLDAPMALGLLPARPVLSPQVTRRPHEGDHRCGGIDAHPHFTTPAVAARMPATSAPMSLPAVPAPRIGLLGARR
jgi:hypothetical protein